MKKRKYKKKSDYWKKFEANGASDNKESNLNKITVPQSAGESYYISHASREVTYKQNGSRRNRSNQVVREISGSISNLILAVLDLSLAADQIDHRINFIKIVTSNIRN